MILYLDTSAYVRLYVREPGHDQVWNAAQGAARVASHPIACAEMRAALARMRRMDRLAGAEVAAIRKTFEQDWRETLRIAPTETMVLRAADMADSSSGCEDTTACTLLRQNRCGQVGVPSS